MDNYYLIQAFNKDGYRGDICPVTRDSPARLRLIVEEFGRNLQREERYDFPPFDAEESAKAHPGYKAYLLGYGPHWVGACAFTRVDARAAGVPDAEWIAGWVWVHPFCRRRGILSKAWAYLEREHGKFLIQTPLSEAMEQFVEKLGVSEDRQVYLK